jgi:hypothetical protein
VVKVTVLVETLCILKVSQLPMFGTAVFVPLRLISKISSPTVKHPAEGADSRVAVVEVSAVTE